MKYVKSCCDKVDGYYQDNMGHWLKTGKVGNQRVRTERGAQNFSMQRALRTATQNGYITPETRMTFKG